MNRTMLLFVLVLAACESRTAITEGTTGTAPAATDNARPSALRVKVDAVHGRLWVLRADRVEVYDRRTHRMISRILLPQWTVADFICEPDITFDRFGAAYISHNLEPKLWKVDPNTFQLKEHILRLVGRENLDIGFGKLTFSHDGTLFGLASTGGSLWRIDVRALTADAVHVEAQLHDGCVTQYGKY